MPDQVVVGAAIVHEGRLLAARRTRPAPAAGRWELPGGKVEPAESPEVAVVREIAEELGCVIEVDGWLDGETRIGPGLVLRVARVRLVAGEPDPQEHDAVRWLTAGELGEVDWLDADRPFLTELGRLLTRAAPTRAVFFEEHAARAVVRRLVADGYEAIVSRERFAGEDDDEDHSWAVVTGAPGPVVEPLVDAHDGWLDTDSDDDPTGGPVVPHNLPASPHRGRGTHPPD